MDSRKSTVPTYGRPYESLLLKLVNILNWERRLSWRFIKNNIITIVVLLMAFTIALSLNVRDNIYLPIARSRWLNGQRNHRTYWGRYTEKSSF